jgi:Uma2 family endonuclease
MTAPIYYTAEQVRAFPEDGNRYEVVHGELLVTPAPRAWHQEIAGRVFESLPAYLRSERVGHGITSPADISWGPDTLVQPDVFVVPLEQARTPDDMAPRFERDRLVWHPADAARPYELSLDELFKPI